METIKWRKKIDVEHIPVATKYNNLPLLMAVRGYKYIDDGNCHVEPELSDSVIRIANCIGGDCFHKFDKEGHPILIDRTVNIYTRVPFNIIHYVLTITVHIRDFTIQRKWVTM
jgi:hypothetical protein